MLTITNESNYLAKVVQLGKCKKHPNADKLLIWDVDGYDVITDLSREEGDVCIFFPVECQIHHDILSNMDMYSDKSLNSNKEVSGYVSKSRRVKAVALRGVISDGIVLPIEKVIKSINSVKSDGIDTAYSIGELFDTVYGIVICNKYVPKEVRSGGGQGQPKKNPLNQYLIEGQFKLHHSTSKLQDNIWKFSNMSDTILITDKWHGTSAVFSNVLTKRKLSYWEKLQKFFRFDIQIKEYSKMYSSRNIIKSIAGKYNSGNHYTDEWATTFENVKHALAEGITLYGEIVGYSGEKPIQKGYTYQCKPGECKFLVYRITHTDIDGKVFEYDRDSIITYCNFYQLEPVKELYYGTIKKWFNKHKTSKDSTLLDTLKEVYLEKDCEYNTGVPAEGICVRNETLDQTAHKLKSKRFLQGETKALDAGEEVVE